MSYREPIETSLPALKEENRWKRFVARLDNRARHHLPPLLYFFVRGIARALFPLSVVGSAYALLLWQPYVLGGILAVFVLVALGAARTPDMR